MQRPARPAFAAIVVMLGFAIGADAQVRPVVPSTGVPPSAPKKKAGTSKTTVSVELLAGRDGAGLHAQEWGQTFERLGVSVRIRQPLLDDKPETKERTSGTLRYVTVIGKLERGGQITFADRAFTRGDAPKLAEWLRELETYGAQGTPDGKPLWGLTKEQFSLVYTALSAKQEDEVNGLVLDEALMKLQPARYSLRLTEATREWLREEYLELPAVRQEVAGTSKGTALAIVLNNYGLGYRPLRTPGGEIELAVDPLKTTTDAWPVGWELKETRLKTAPQLFELTPVELKDAPLPDVLAGISAKTGVPAFIDYYRIEGKRIAVDRLLVNSPPRKTSWSLLLRSATTPHKLTRRILIDDLGQPIIWITVFDPGSKDD